MLGNHVESPVADWPTKRAWVDYAFDRLAEAGYAVSSAYTMVKDKSKVNFSYRDNLWHGSDLLATGVASFGHASGVHYQNEPEWAAYVGRLERGELPLYRGLRPTAHQLLVRELILQLKTGRLDSRLFPRQVWNRHHRRTGATPGSNSPRRATCGSTPSRWTLTRAGLLRVDALLPAFFEPEHRSVRYT